MNKKAREAVRSDLERALKEDCPDKDITTVACVPAASISRATVVAKEEMVVCGLTVFKEVMRLVDDRIKVTFKAKEGQAVKKATPVLAMKGPSRSILTGERVALNYLQRMSGVATLTARFVEKVKGSNATILDTRKTTPAMRLMEKYAVKCGGGKNHRMGLSDQALIKENHIRAAGGIAPAVKAAKKKSRKPVILEVTNQAEVLEGLEAGAPILLLDNMTPAQVKQMVKLIDGRATVEVSGGVTLKTVAAYAKAGAQRISVGALTHSVKAADLSLLFDE